MLFRSCDCMVPITGGFYSKRRGYRFGFVSFEELRYGLYGLPFTMLEASMSLGEEFRNRKPLTFPLIMLLLNVFAVELTRSTPL